MLLIRVQLKVMSRCFVGWVERSEPHHFSHSFGGFRFALPTLQTSLLITPF
jgi:hypothetical protein